MSNESVPEQFTLFDLGLDLRRAQNALEELMQHGKQAANTIRGYAASWKTFERWCERTRHAALPAEAQTIKMFIGWVFAERVYRMSNLQHILSAIRDRHTRAGLPSPVSQEVRDLVLAAQRKLCEKPARKEAITVRQLSQVIQRLDTKSARGLRDRALLLFAFASSWRRSEIASLKLASIELGADGLLVRLGKSKGDQEGNGREIAIPYAKKRPELCAVRAMERWLTVRGPQAGPLFLSFHRGYKNPGQGIDGPGINFVFKRALRAADIDPKPYGAHSLRAGSLTAAAAANANPLWMMKRSGHGSLRAMAPYIRARKNFEMDPLKNVI